MDLLPLWLLLHQLDRQDLSHPLIPECLAVLLARQFLGCLGGQWGLSVLRLPVFLEGLLVQLRRLPLAILLVR